MPFSYTDFVQGDEVKIDDQYHAEISELLANEQMRLALNHILEIEAQSLADLVELTEILPPFNEHARAQRFLALLKETG